MNARAICPLAMACGVLLGTAQQAQAQAHSDSEWTVLTVARNGAWGLSTARSQGEAIAGALRQCRSRSAYESDCGAELVAYKVNWCLAVLCGNHRVMVSADSLEAGESAAYERIGALKRSYALGLPPCRRVLTIDPDGAVWTGEASSKPFHQGGSFGWYEAF